MQRKIESVKLSQCSEGSVIVAHGGRWQIVERLDNATKPNGFRSFRSLFLGECGQLVDADSGKSVSYCAVPDGWRKDWVLQSNDYADWCREA